MAIQTLRLKILAPALAFASSLLGAVEQTGQLMFDANEQATASPGGSATARQATVLR